MRTKITKLILILIVCGALPGCITYKPQSEFDLKSDDEIKLQAACVAINSNGSMMQLMADVDTKRDLIFSLLESPDPNQYAAQVGDLVVAIEKDLDSVKKMSTADDVNVFYPSKLSWTITPRDLNFVGRGCSDGDCSRVTIDSATLQKVFIQGKMVDDLGANFSISTENNILTVSYNAAISPLDYCQLQQTLYALVNVQYTVLGHPMQKSYVLNVRY